MAGSELLEQGRIANENPPKLKAFDRFGHRIDEVEFHPAYHRCMTLAMEHGLHAFAWWHADQPSAHVARSAITYQHAQFEAGTGCPLTMTYAAIPALRHSPELAKVWVPRLTSKVYDPRVLPASQKLGCTIGMGMTEKQGGSDVRSNTTTATAQADGHYTLVGHKWFFSAPMCDAWLVLAQAPAGITCFLLPKVLEDGSRNRIHIQRLKDKLGDRSNASSEVEFHNAVGLRVGDEGRGVRTILEMVALTRLDCMVASAGLMRQATVQAIHHCRQRSAFGKPLITQPLMQNVLHDLVIENDGHLALAMRVAQAVDQGPNDPAQAAFARIATAIGKYWICRRAPAWSTRRRSAWAARGTWKKPCCRGCTGRRRSTRSGKAAATCSASTCCARCRANPTPAKPCLASCWACRAPTPILTVNWPPCHACSTTWRRWKSARGRSLSASPWRWKRPACCA